MQSCPPPDEEPPIRWRIRIYLLLWLILPWLSSPRLPWVFPRDVRAQDCPALGTELLPGLTGEALVTALRAAYRPAAWLSYDEARDVMYTEVDNENGTVTGRYTGYQAFIDPASLTPRMDANDQQITTEHSWPQSKGADVSPMRSDMHHLFPTYALANGARGNSPYDEIPDELTDTWYRLTEQTSTRPTTFLDEYSELDLQNPSPLYDHRFEPREDHKGDVARAMFYFYTVYRTEADAADPHFFETQKAVLRVWHQADPVSAREYERTCAIAPYQSDKVNPFVVDPTLVERAYFSGGGTTLVQFVTADDVVRESDGTYDIDILILGADVQPTQVDVALVGGTATNGVDIEPFTTQTVAFPGGSVLDQSVTVTIVLDEEVENDETLIFQLQNASGGNQAAIGEPSEFTLTLRDDFVPFPVTLWVNEFHYDNASTDVGEFVEVAAAKDFPDLAGVTLTLYNGNGGAMYAAYSGGTDFVPGAAAGDVQLYRVDTPALQNGSPDGFALDYNGALVQFLSYEGTFTAADGPAAGQTSQDVQVEEGSGTPEGLSISLQGSGPTYESFTWAAGVTATPGAVNTGQTITVGTPVLMQRFDVALRAAGAELRWATAAEADLWGFLVHRRDGGGPWMPLSAGLVQGGPSYEVLDADVRPGHRYDYRLEAVGLDQSSEFFGPVSLAVPADFGSPRALRLTAGPNPAFAGVQMRYDLTMGQPIRLSVYDLAGRLVRVLDEGTRPAGPRSVLWDGRDQSGRELASGVYFARLETARESVSARVTLLR